MEYLNQPESAMVRAMKEKEEIAATIMIRIIGYGFLIGMAWMVVRFCLRS